MSLSEGLPAEWSRVIIVSVSPQVDGGRYPVRRSIGDEVAVTAGIIIDGHDKIAAEVHYRHQDGEETVLPLTLKYNDEYHARFEPTELGRWYFHVEAWVDTFGTWHGEFRRRVDGGESDEELRSELLEGATHLRKAAESAKASDKRTLNTYAKRFEEGEIEAGLEDKVLELARRHQPRRGMVKSDEIRIEVDSELARFAAWYEFFPRSAANEEGVHGTLDDAAERLEGIKNLGFDIVYLPPIHPIGTTFRKGKDNDPKAKPGEPGSPWAIGAKDGGHKAVHADLGGMEAFDRFVTRADELGLMVALDIAYQTSPDHPYVKDHPEWFRHRPDGSIRYAENPPKKYQDVYPFEFENENWEGLWKELRSVFEHWIEHGVRVFRVDNPHTKSLAFWEWCIRTLREKHPDLIFLSEAFARPKMMYTLAKIGFNNSYTYFTWRNTKEELTEYATEVFTSDVADFYRANFWPNTPDILHEYLVYGGRPAHIVRFVLAATLASAYGIYGPPYEHVVNKKHPAREEYADNEKYEIRTWNWNDPHSLQPLMRRINRIRRENPALQFTRSLKFHEVDNPQIIAYSKRHGDNVVLTVVNLDPHHQQSGWLTLDPEALGRSSDRPYQVHDLLGGEHYLWQGDRHYLQLSPHVLPAHIFQIRREVSSEQDFPYYL